jgi:hypothetical protein
VAGENQGAERKRTIDEVSKNRLMSSKPGRLDIPGISMREIRLLLM